MEYEFENGRRYHAYKAGRAYFISFHMLVAILTSVQIIRCPTMRHVFDFGSPSMPYQLTYGPIVRA